MMDFMLKELNKDDILVERKIKVLKQIRYAEFNIRVRLGIYPVAVSFVEDPLNPGRAMEWHLKSENGREEYNPSDVEVFYK